MTFILDLLPGLGTTFLLWLGILAIGLPCGLFFGYLLMYLSPALRWIAIVIVNIARGFPGLVILYFAYAGLPEFQIFLSATMSIVIAFAFTTMGYTAVVFRTALEEVPRQQVEAATALGLGFFNIQRLVVLPQALKSVLPPLIGFTVIVLQATSLGYSVGLQELTGLSYNLGSVSFQALPYMIAAGAIYLVLCLIISQLADWLGRRSGGSRKPSRRSRLESTPAEFRPKPTTRTTTIAGS